MYHLWKNVYLDPLTILSLGYLLFVCGGFFFFFGRAATHLETHFPDQGSDPHPWR